MPDERTELHNGRVVIEFQEKGHKYVVWVDGKKTKPPSVTTITGVVDKSGPIQNWAIKQTLNACKELIQPGQPYSVQELDRIWETARKASWIKKQEAADVGTAVHEWLRLYFHGQEPELPPEDPYQSCVLAALAWVKQHKVEMIHNERPVYSMKYGVSGRLDGICLIDGKKSVIDFKSGNGIYAEMGLQVSAYQKFYEEETEDKIEQRAIIRLGKEDGRFYQRIYTQGSEEDFKAFLGALTLYTRLKEIEKERKKVEISTNKRNWLDELDS